MNSDLVAALTQSGWTNEYRASNAWTDAAIVWMQSVGFDVTLAAEASLRRFGGLRMGQYGPGISASRAVVDFDPFLCEGEQDRFSRVGQGLGVPLSPLGELNDGHAFIGIADDGSVYYFDSEIWRAGHSDLDALDSLLLGKKCPILNPETGRFTFEW